MKTNLVILSVVLLQAAISVAPASAADEQEDTRYERMILRENSVYQVSRSGDEASLRISARGGGAAKVFDVTRFFPPRSLPSGPVRFNVKAGRVFCVLSAYNMSEVRGILLDDIVEQNRPEEPKTFREVWVDSKGVTRLGAVFLSPVRRVAHLAKAVGATLPTYDVLPRATGRLELYILSDQKISVWQIEMQQWTEASTMQINWSEGSAFIVDSSGPFHALEQGSRTYLVFESGPVYVIGNGTATKIGDLPGPAANDPVLVVDEPSQSIAVVSASTPRTELSQPRKILRNGQIIHDVLPAAVSEAVARKRRSK